MYLICNNFSCKIGTNNITIKNMTRHAWLYVSILQKQYLARLYCKISSAKKLILARYEIYMPCNSSSKNY